MKQIKKINKQELWERILSYNHESELVEAMKIAEKTNIKITSILTSMRRQTRREHKLLLIEFLAKDSEDRSLV